MKRRWLFVLVLVLLMLELTGQSGCFRASTLGGETITNTPWQLSGSRVAIAGDAQITVDCAPASDHCLAMKQALATTKADATLTVHLTLSASEPSWCYLPFYKRGELSYDATADIAVKGAASKRIGMRGHVEASGFGIESCGFVRKFLVYLATQDVRRQLNDAAGKGRELMWKCADGNLHGNQDEQDPCAPM